MIKNYFRTVMRNLSNNKGYATLYIIGAASRKRALRTRKKANGQYNNNQQA